MKTLIARPLVGLAAWWLDDTVGVDKLHAWMARTSEALGRAQAALPEASRADLAAADALMRESGSVAGWPTLTLDAGGPTDRLPSLEHATAWMAGRGDRSAVVKGVLAAGAGRHLGRLIHHRDDAQIEAFVWEALDKLLRHVEVRRQAALGRVEPAADAPRAVLERLDVTALFCRVARLDRDVRFLNAALKLNDWAYPSISKLRPADDARVPRYLLSLAEQEAAAKELLP